MLFYRTPARCAICRQFWFYHKVVCKYMQNIMQLRLKLHLNIPFSWNSSFQYSEVSATLVTFTFCQRHFVLSSFQNNSEQNSCLLIFGKLLQTRMPPITRAQLVNQKDLSVDKLAALADTFMVSQLRLCH